MMTLPEIVVKQYLHYNMLWMSPGIVIGFHVDKLRKKNDEAPENKKKTGKFPSPGKREQGMSLRWFFSDGKTVKIINQNCIIDSEKLSIDHPRPCARAGGIPETLRTRQTGDVM